MKGIIIILAIALFNLNNSIAQWVKIGTPQFVRNED